MTIVYNIFYNLAKLLARMIFSMRVIHPERMVESGPLLIAVNHSSFFDPPLAGICSKRGVYYLARKTLLKWPFFGPLFPAMNVIPVERDGNDMSALREVIKKVKDGNAVLLFPEGTRSVDGHLQPARAGIGLVIAKTGAPVDRASSPLPWLAAAVVFFYIALLVLRFTLPPAKVDVEVLTRPAASAN
ncbi:MAG: lysophospholipid acyltransferase family protein [Verrucomicrobia bacterium]|nr:lysophospholipid acyltransferase family protein [Verrucomicrobiota bacterium]